MKLQLLVVGRLKEAYLASAEAEYLKRLRPMCKLEVIEVADEARLLASLPDRCQLVLFDERGDLLTSRQFAGVLEHHQLHGGGLPLVFAIGGADGHSDALRQRADRMVAFGRLTIAHRLVRLLAVEQIYRGFSILRGTKYHRD